MARGQDIEERLVDFAVRIIAVCNALPETSAGRHLGGRTAPALHYGAARSAESRRDFVHKLRLALKEVNETNTNRKIIQRSRLLSEDRLHAVMDESTQLARILNQSIQTTLSNKTNRQ